MIIKKLTLRNFGIYASENTFCFSGEKPVVLIGGMNGRGKTTFLEAVLLALYGPNSFAYTESKYKSYGQYLKAFVNKSDGTLETSVELEFKMDSNENETYRIQRAWSGNRQRVSESIKVFRNGDYNQFLTDNWTMFIENILPSGLSNFFFFDGEKIAELAVESTSKQMKESIKTLLGISILDLLQADINRIVSRITKDQIKKAESQKLEQLRLERDSAAAELDNIDSEIEKLELSKASLTQKLEQKQQEYSLKGGDIVAQRSELVTRRNTVTSHMEAARELLVSDAASEIPLALVTDLLTGIRKESEKEQDRRLLDAAYLKLQSLSKEYIYTHSNDEKSINRFVDYVYSQKMNDNDSDKYNLNDGAILKLQILLDEELSETKAAIKDKIDTISKLKSEMDQIDSYMSVEINEKEIAKVYRQIKETEQSLIDYDVKITKRIEERKTINWRLINANTAFNRYVEEYLRRAELNDDADRILKYSQMALTVLDEYKIRLQRQKIATVADTMTGCYKTLANKTTLIDHIEIDHVTLDFSYINDKGEAIDKSTLSAGEKQLMVIALLWALAICSKKKLPVIIDTPLSRLDSAHRLSLIQTYFPRASEQTIILSTDEEIDRNYYERMKDNIGDEFTLVYDDESKSTTIHRGYFLEGENDRQTNQIV